MNAAEAAAKAKAKPTDNGPPEGVPPSQLVSQLLAKGRPPFAKVPFPRFDEDGRPICDVIIQLIPVTEEDVALANARKYVAEKLRTKSDDLPWRPEELEHNARILELLAVACKDPEDPTKPFFTGGVYEARRFFNSDEMGVLANVYATLKTQMHPSLRNMTEEEMEGWITALSEGWDSFPFALLSRGQMETLCEYCARCLVEAKEQLKQATPISSSSSD